MMITTIHITYQKILFFTKQHPSQKQNEKRYLSQKSSHSQAQSTHFGERRYFQSQQPSFVVVVVVVCTVVVEKFLVSYSGRWDLRGGTTVCEVRPGGGICGGICGT